MPIIPFRNIGAKGIITDVSPYDLEMDSWTAGRNVRFLNGSVANFSVFKNPYPSVVHPIGENDTPVGGGSIYLPSGISTFTVSRDYTIRGWTSQGIQDLTPTTAGWLDTPSDERMTTTFIGGVTYINRYTKPPVYKTPADDRFSPVSGWSELDRCRSLRAYKDFLIAIGVTKGVVDYPAMFKWSDAVQYGMPPPTWDVTADSSLAGEDVLNEATSALVDGYPLNDSFVLYTRTESFLLDYVGSPFIFNKRKLFTDDGAMSVNCVTEVNNLQYVFGTYDIYAHDGITKKSLTEGRVKEYIYSIIDNARRDRCFVVHNPHESEVLFCFPTRIDESIPSATGDCNMAAVYNYVNDTWSFADIPNAVASLEVDIVPTDTWDTMLDRSWSQMDGSWTSMSSDTGSIRAMVSAGQGTAQERPAILALDDPYDGRLSAPVAANFQPEAYVERTSIDMDAIGAEITGRKMIRRLFPQVDVGGDEVKFAVTLGKQTYSGSSISWEPPQVFDPATSYKIDTRNTGRYLAMRFSASAASYWRISGYDMDLITISGR